MKKTSFTDIPASHRNRGFVLVTSLIFLVVVTLLAVSAMNASTLQEKMASNVREKSRALQGSDAGLRQGELLLEDQAFDIYQAPGSNVALKSADQEGNTSALKVWLPDGMLGKKVDRSNKYENDGEAFLANSIWKSGDAMSYTLDDDMPPVSYYVEDHDFIARDLNPDTAAVADGGVVYRITAHANGQNPAAVAVTQSLYEKHY